MQLHIRLDVDLFNSKSFGQNPLFVQNSVQFIKNGNYYMYAYNLVSPILIMVYIFDRYSNKVSFLIKLSTYNES